ncbi:S8 family serine peptidase [Planosporangium thailandense]|uniref:S8 family serine peptidase n=1 Tax=Planosporangium thailandense TaxID=765197 RepID=A0ABX0Y1U2_9ACTN|nr:S8 family serine peptidase [Planosporangium thailandense]NJC72330.1 S8 family serine peptidase [Planosporangium thailandense]
MRHSGRGRLDGYRAGPVPGPGPAGARRARRWRRHPLVARIAAGGAAVVLVALGVVVVAPTPAAATCKTTRVPQPLPSVSAQPWPQQHWDFKQLAALGADGTGVTVAVIDSGVDAHHPQLRGQVLTGWDAFEKTGNGQEDCVGHGTEVASLIAARRIPGTPFQGLAPGVKILPIRANEHTEGNDSGRGTPAELAQAIDQAVQRHARVINLSLVLTEDNPDVHRAIDNALANNVVVVAAVGNAHGQNGGKDPTPYPAAYKGVIGVGAIDETGVRLAQSQVGSYVSLVAPGHDIQAALPGGGYQMFEGTSMATPFVSAAAAIVIQKYGRTITPRQVAARLMATADPAPGPPGSPEYGQGVLNPYRAATGVLATGAQQQASPLPGIERDPAAEAAAAASLTRRRTVALWLVGGVATVAALVVALAVVVPRGRARGWRPGPADET